MALVSILSYVYNKFKGIQNSETETETENTIIDSIYILHEIAKHDKNIWITFSSLNKELNRYFNTHSLKYELCFRTIKIDKYGNTLYKLNGKYHRTDGPAIITKKYEEYWYINGKYHRTDGPAVVMGDSCTWYNNGKIHRIGGPAVLRASGTEFWYENDKLHRIDGPAAIYRGGSLVVEEWWINGIKVNKSYFNSIEVNKPESL